MSPISNLSPRLLSAALVLAVSATSSFGQEGIGNEQEPGAFQLLNQRMTWFQDTGAQAEPEPATDLEAPSCPVSFSINYTFISDYIFRGINFSEYRGEGQEEINHQLGTSIAYSLGQYGTVGFDAWFEWFAGQEKINPRNGDDNLQEVDFVVWWSYDLEAIKTALTIGWTHFLFPNTARNLRTDASQANNNDDRTHEWWFSLEHNDAWMWTWLWAENEDGILNPTFFFSQDIGIGSGRAMWMEFGLSHEFQVAPKVTVTPSWTLTADHGYYHYFAGANRPSTRLATMLWGFDVTYDMTELLGVPDGWGSVALSGLLYFSDALGNAEDNRVIQDEFFGGFGVTYSIGG